MKKAAFIFVFVLTLTAASAQNSWTNRYSGPGNTNDIARAVAVDGSGNVFVTGSSTGNDGVSGYATIKYSNSGVPLWTNRFNGPGTSSGSARAIAVDNSGDVLVTGVSPSSAGNYDYVTVKYSNDGLPMWTNRYNGPGSGADLANAVAVDGNGRVFVTGYSQGSSAHDFATVAYAGTGVALWTNRYNGLGNGNDEALAVVVDGVGDVFVTGPAWGGGSANSTGDYATIKYSNGGTPLWTNWNGLEIANAIAADGDGNLFATGYSINTGSSWNYATIKYSSNGVLLWTNRYNGPANDLDIANAIAMDGNGNVFVTGQSIGAGSGMDYATIKYANDGTPLWTNRYNGPGNGDDVARAIAVDDEGYVFVTGYSAGAGSGQDYATIKYSNDGIPLWTNRYNGLGNSTDTAYAISVDSSGNALVTGASFRTGSGLDYVTIKYAATLPQISVLEKPQASAGNFSFDLVAEPGGQFAIQVSTNLVDWEEIEQVTIPAGGRTNIVETLAPGPTQRFYRAQRQ